MLQFTRLFPSNLYFILLFMVALISFQLNHLTVEFFVLFTLFIIVAFLKEKQRAFVWMTIAYFLGEFLHLYANRFLNEMDLPIQTVFIVEKLLLLFPIFSILYVSYKFKQNRSFILMRTFSKEAISEWYRSSRRKRNFLLSFTILALLLSFISLVQQSFSITKLGHFLLFVLISSIIEEILWRGLLMQAMHTLTNKWTAVILSSICYGCSYLMYGYSIGICFVFALSGVLYALMTLYYKNLIPAFLCHYSILSLVILVKMIPFPFL
ncbi:CPBP family intramembrane glutamic endopeptidase [Bacillus tuaregi]|uniref:CPBP family intramembrane glutamic endopeptidase n=1 Tax=Bacillus tuaregi TaxID=1816695 RepID=UPI0008F80DF7|nr:CPBP family intramembrane glutamic endopeptidase [Bacillus tuaregi]